MNFNKLKTIKNIQFYSIVLLTTIFLIFIKINIPWDWYVYIIFYLLFISYYYLKRIKINLLMSVLIFLLETFMYLYLVISLLKIINYFSIFHSNFGLFISMFIFVGAAYLNTIFGLLIKRKIHDNRSNMYFAIIIIIFSYYFNEDIIDLEYGSENFINIFWIVILVDYLVVLIVNNYYKKNNNIKNDKFDCNNDSCYFIDLPIEKKEQDYIGLDVYSEAIFKAIKNEAKFIALISPYGTGKSSLINLVSNYNDEIMIKKVNLWHTFKKSNVNQPDDGEDYSEDIIDLHTSILLQLSEGNSKKYTAALLNKNFIPLNFISEKKMYLSFLIIGLALYIFRQFFESLEINHFKFITSNAGIIGVGIIILSIIISNGFLVSLNFNKSKREISPNEILNRYEYLLNKNDVIVFEDLDRINDNSLIRYFLKDMFNIHERMTKKPVMIFALKEIYDDFSDQCNLLSYKYFDFIVKLDVIKNIDFNYVLLKELESKKDLLNSNLGINIPLNHLNMGYWGELSNFKFNNIRFLKHRINRVIFKLELFKSSRYINEYLCWNEEERIKKAIMSIYLEENYPHALSNVLENNNSLNKLILEFMKHGNINKEVTSIINEIKNKINVQNEKNNEDNNEDNNEFLKKLQEYLISGTLDLDYELVFYKIPKNLAYKSKDEILIDNLLFYSNKIDISDADLSITFNEDHTDYLLSKYDQLISYDRQYDIKLYFSKIVIDILLTKRTENFIDQTIYAYKNYNDDNYIKFFVKHISKLENRNSFYEMFAKSIWKIINNVNGIIVVRNIIIDSKLLNFKELKNFYNDKWLISTTEISKFNTIQALELVDVNQQIQFYEERVIEFINSRVPLDANNEEFLIKFLNNLLKNSDKVIVSKILLKIGLLKDKEKAYELYFSNQLINENYNGTFQFLLDIIYFYGFVPNYINKHLIEKCSSFDLFFETLNTFYEREFEIENENKLLNYAKDLIRKNYNSINNNYEFFINHMLTKGFYYEYLIYKFKLNNVFDNLFDDNVLTNSKEIKLAYIEIINNFNIDKGILSPNIIKRLYDQDEYKLIDGKKIYIFAWTEMNEKFVDYFLKIHKNNLTELIKFIDNIDVESNTKSLLSYCIKGTNKLSKIAYEKNSVELINKLNSVLYNYVDSGAKSSISNRLNDIVKN